MVEDGEGELAYEGKKYDLKAGDVVFIDCQKAYSHSTGNAHGVDNAPVCNRSYDGSSSCDDHSTGGAVSENLWSLRWCHFYGPSMPAIYAKYCERGGLPVILGADVAQYAAILTDYLCLIHRCAISSSSYRLSIDSHKYLLQQGRQKP